MSEQSKNELFLAARVGMAPSVSEQDEQQAAFNAAVAASLGGLLPDVIASLGTETPDMELDSILLGVGLEPVFLDGMLKPLDEL